MIIILHLLIGLILLFWGRKLFWLFVAAVGFVVGFTYGPEILNLEPSLAALLAGILTGIIGALLAVFLKKAAIALAGFAGGGYLAVSLRHYIASATELSFWLLFITGGIIGVILFLLLFDWALIAISSLVGATFVIEPFGLQPGPKAVLFLVLAIAGILVQAGLLRKEKNLSRR
jgi:hypothetical protein